MFGVNLNNTSNFLVNFVTDRVSTTGYLQSRMTLVYIQIGGGLLVSLESHSRLKPQRFNLGIQTIEFYYF